MLDEQYRAARAARHARRDPQTDANLAASCAEFAKANLEALPELAAELLLRTLTLAPRGSEAHASALTDLALCAMQRGKLLAALRYLERATRADTPQHASAVRFRVRLNLCATLYRLGRPADALRQARTAVLLLGRASSRVLGATSSSGETSTVAALPPLPRGSFRHPSIFCDDGGGGGGRDDDDGDEAAASAAAANKLHDEAAAYERERAGLLAVALHNCSLCHERLGHYAQAVHLAADASELAAAALMPTDPLVRRLAEVYAQVARRSAHHLSMARRAETRRIERADALRRRLEMQSAASSPVRPTLSRSLPQLGRGGRSPVAAREAPPRTAQPSVSFSQLVTVAGEVGPEPKVGAEPSVRFSNFVAVAGEVRPEPEVGPGTSVRFSKDVAVAED